MTQTVEDIIIGLTEDFIEEWGIDDVELSKETYLKADLGFDSSDTMQLFAAIAENYNHVEFKFQELVVQDDKYVDDLKLGQIIVFVIRKLSTATGEAA